MTSLIYFQAQINVRIVIAFTLLLNDILLSNLNLSDMVAPIPSNDEMMLPEDFRSQLHFDNDAKEDQGVHVDAKSDDSAKERTDINGDHGSLANMKGHADGEGQIE